MTAMIHVLIVDDDRDHAESIAEILEMRGFEVELAFSGEEAVARFRDVDFDIVLMDIKLPGINGVEAFFEFKKVRPAAHVLMMTGYSVEQLAAQAVEHGALGILRKPFCIPDLLAALALRRPRTLVLIADDDPDFVTSIAPILAGNGYTVRVASTGAEALEKVGVEGVDCLILDVRLPVLSGPEVYARLCAEGNAVPTILVTGYAGGEEVANAASLEPPLGEVLLKPFDPRTLLAAIGAAVAPPSSPP
jgi:DNA-binding response OmpR family regulator